MPTMQTESDALSQRRGLGIMPALREVAVVLIVALVGLVVAAAIVLAPWHPAEAAVIVELLPPG
jgi:hypothetical protein